jgi:hypothetical protein
MFNVGVLLPIAGALYVSYSKNFRERVFKKWENQGKSADSAMQRLRTLKSVFIAAAIFNFVYIILILK